MITIQVREVSSFIEKTRGLIGQKKIEPTLFSTRLGIHTFGMKIMLDIIVLDRNYIIVKVKENLPPARFFFWNPKYDLIIELPAGFISKNKLGVGKRLILQKAGRVV